MLVVGRGFQALPTRGLKTPRYTKPKESPRSFVVRPIRSPPDFAFGFQPVVRVAPVTSASLQIELVRPSSDAIPLVVFGAHDVRNRGRRAIGVFNHRTVALARALWLRAVAVPRRDRLCDLAADQLLFPTRLCLDRLHSFRHINSLLSRGNPRATFGR